MREKILSSLLLIAIAALAYTAIFFQTALHDAQNQITDGEKQLEHYKNSTSSIQKEVDILINQLTNLKNPVYNVTIESITSTGWGTLVGLEVDNGFYITIKNTGIKDVGGLTFKFNVLDNGTIWESQAFSVGLISPLQLGVLHVQESAVIVARLESHVGVSFGGKALQVIVMYDETVLDECSIVLERGYG